eukprot:GHVS01013852.1.p1 GENE.GHVS01013852.1~~GHVS01013852.1.p1  ORF type:complete len:517 (+),score=116.00 GHVS01013852.1:48-1553(+)
MAPPALDWAVLNKLEAHIPHYNGLTKCTWSPGSCEESCPHHVMEAERKVLRHQPICSSILSNVLDFVGNTPMIRLERFASYHGLACELVAKCEFFSAGGSVKDRIGKRMVEEAERDNKLHMGDTLIEPTSGNTGVGLAMAAAVKGYRMMITMPEKMSMEKFNVMKALGAEILRTPTEAAWNSPESHIGLAMKLQQHIPNAIILDQYKNPANPMAHYEETAEEILEQCDGRLDMVVVAAGTGGTITGIGRKMKEKCPSCTVVGVDPRGSILAVPESLNDAKRNESYLVEGIGYDFLPTTLDRNVVDEWVKSEDAESFELARDLIRLEGLLCGGSSGAAMVGVLQAARRLNKGQRCVVVLPDSCRNYMSKFVSDQWMVDQDFIKQNNSVEDKLFRGQCVRDLQLAEPVTTDSHARLSAVVDLMHERGLAQLPVVEEGGGAVVVGVVTSALLANSLESGRVQMQDCVKDVMLRKFRSVREEARLDVVSRLLDVHSFVLVTTKKK